MTGYVNPLPQAIRDAVDKWPIDGRVEWSERAAIIEYDGGEDRETAERKAYYELRRRWQHDQQSG